MFLKNITISFIIFFLWAWSVFAADPYQSQTDLNNAFSDVQYDTPPQAWYVTNSKTNIDLWNGETSVWKDSWNGETSNGIEWASNSTKSSAPAQFNCTPGKDSLCSDQFKIDTSKFSPGGKGLNKASSKATINGFMTTLIKKLMVALWSLALIIMVVWAGFMIMSMWKDDNLNKWKTIFKAWIIALAIALSSYFMVSFLSYILYSI